jgi:hypothetical protein
MRKMRMKKNLKKNLKKLTYKKKFNRKRKLRNRNSRWKRNFTFWNKKIQRKVRM